MKKIYISENTISNVVNGRLLPQFLFKLVKTHTTSLGDNEAFPSSDDYPFDYVLLKKRYNEVCDAIDDIGLVSLNEDDLVSELSSLVTECKRLEEPVRDALEKICENALNRLFAIPEESINMSFKLVDKIKFKSAIRMRPESNDDVKYTFKDIADIDLSNKAVGKRRFINALIQGAAYLYSGIEGLYIDDIDKINPKLPRLYRKIRIINDYLLFTKKEEMSDDKPMQGSYVETHLGIADTKTTIKVQGLVFPLLFQESIKGLFELFSAHGLPQDRDKAQYIIKKADFVLAEPWDLRLGVGLWKMIFGGVEDTNMIPYMFTSFVKIPTNEFNLSVKEILSNTEKGNEIVNSLMKDAEYDNGYQQFTNRINAKNVDKSLIKDSYFTGAETNGYELDSDVEEGDVIEENGEEQNSEIMGIIANATVDNIDFIEGESDEYGEKVYLSVDGIEIPNELVNLDFRVVYKRFPTGKQQLLNIDIILDPQLRGYGLGTKIYAKAVREFGAICSRHSTRHNDDGIRGIFGKLNSFNDIAVFQDTYNNFENETICDYYAILKSELPKYFGNNITESRELIKENTFESWFGNSILKDGDGKPLKMYHGTDSEFDIFSKERIGRTGAYEGYGFNFTPFESRARGYNSINVIEAYLKVENPMTTKSHKITLNKLIKIISELDKGKPFTDTIVAAYEPARYNEKWDAMYYRRALPIAAKTIYNYNKENNYGDAGLYAEICLCGQSDKIETINLFERLGYDSAIFYDNNDRINTVIVFEPNQIKRTSNKTFSIDSDVMSEQITE